MQDFLNNFTSYLQSALTNVSVWVTSPEFYAQLGAIGFAIVASIPIVGRRWLCLWLGVAIVVCSVAVAMSASSEFSGGQKTDDRSTPGECCC